jgi:hypothetical protein
MRTVGCAGLALVMFSGCSSGTDLPGERIGQSESAIINGTPIQRDDMLIVGGGTATLLTREWALTCGHCIAGAPIQSFTFTQTTTGQSRVGVEKYNHPTLDVALVRMAAPFSIGGSNYAVNSLYSGTNAGLFGKQADCYGFGYNTFNGGFGTLRHGLMSIVEEPGGPFPGAWYKLLPNAQGQIIWLGDSGGACFVQQGNQWAISGVHVMVAYSPDDQQVLYSWDATVPNYYSWTQDRVNRMTASLRYTTQWQTGYCAEITVTNHGSTSTGSWEVVFDVHQSSPYNTWNAAFSHNGSVYAADSLDWNRILQPGGSQTFGLCANKTGSTWQPQILAASHCPALGDADGDGNIDTDDANLVAAEVVGNQASPFHQCAADVNCDHTVNMTDSLLIGQYAAGTITRFPCSP